MGFRHEWKHEINYLDMLMLRQCLSAAAQRDDHTINGKYQIRSLYFDNLYDKALREKMDGINEREKFRIRYYNGDTSTIHLEKKYKVNGLGDKQMTELTVKEAQNIVDGNLTWMAKAGDRPLVQELYSKMLSQGLRPKTIVDYEREPFIYGPGNVRITLDYNIRTGIRCVDFLNLNAVMIPVKDAPIILEVKWDEYLPDVIKSLIQLKGRHSSAYSKYAACRIYG